MPASKEQYQYVQEAAIQLIASIGIERLDAMALDASATIKRGLAKQLAADKQVTMQTARLHITKACRRLRNPDYKPAIQWGGDRRSEDFEEKRKMTNWQNKLTRNTPVQRIIAWVMDDFGVRISESTAEDIKYAHQNGSLSWTSEHLITTDSSQLKIYPQD